MLFDLMQASTYNPAFVTAQGGTIAAAEAIWGDTGILISRPGALLIPSFSALTQSGHWPDQNLRPGFCAISYSLHGRKVLRFGYWARGALRRAHEASPIHRGSWQRG